MPTNSLASLRLLLSSGDSYTGTVLSSQGSKVLLSTIKGTVELEGSHPVGVDVRVRNGIITGQVKGVSTLPIFYI